MCLSSMTFEQQLLILLWYVIYVPIDKMGCVCALRGKSATIRLTQNGWDTVA